MILNRNRFAILSDIWGRFRSLSLISPVTPVVGPGDDGYLWIDIGVDGTPDNPLWKMWDEAAATWRLIGGGAGDEGMSFDDHMAIGNAAPHHAPVTLGEGSDPALSLSGQELTLAPHTHSKLVASDGSPDPAVYTDAAGRFKADYGLDVAGTVTASGDMYPRGDRSGIMIRTIDWGYTPDVHFRSGNVIPSGYSWRTTSPFLGTPTQVQYDYRNDYFRATNYPGSSGKCFLARDITNSPASWQNKGITGRFTVGSNTEIGLRLDDGTDNEYAEIYLYGTTGSISAFFRYRLNGGSVTTNTSSVNVPASFFLSLRLYMYWTGSAYRFYGYVGHEGGEANITGFDVACTPGRFPANGRVGILLGGSGNFGYCDWLHCSFT